MKTRTGGFPIGFRRGWSDWQKDLDQVIAWARQEMFEVIDLGRDGDTGAKKVMDAGLRVGSADLPEWVGMISPDAAKRRAAAARNAAYVKTCTAVGVENFFVVMLPEDAGRDRSANFADMVDGFGHLVADLEAAGARIVIEGWPGPGALCCTPEGYAALFKELPSPALGVNYDPSHLVRMGIDPLRFLEDFGDRVYHVHGKDTEILPERQYQLGTEQPPTFAEGIGFGGNHWRYCIPGHGCVRWTKVFEMLKARGYAGAVCIELEDHAFNGTEAGEKAGLVFGGRFLEGC